MITITNTFLENAQSYGRRLDLKIIIDDVEYGSDDILRLEHEFEADLFRTSMVEVNAQIKGEHYFKDEWAQVYVGINNEFIFYGRFLVT